MHTNFVAGALVEDGDGEGVGCDGGFDVGLETDGPRGEGERRTLNAERRILNIEY